MAWDSKEYYQKNKEREKARVIKYYQENKDAIRIRRHKQYLERNKWLNEYKLSRGCSVCGYNKCAAALDFHHSDCRKVGEKEFNIATAMNSRLSMKKIKKEIEKCVIFCCNCHREYHQKEVIK